MAPVRRRARLASAPSSDAKSFEGEGPFLLHHEVDGSPELVGEDGKGFGLSMLLTKLFDEFLGGWVGPQKENGGFGEGPLQVDVSDLGSPDSQSFSRGASSRISPVERRKRSSGCVRSVRSGEFRRAWSWRGFFRRRGWSEGQASSATKRLMKRDGLRQDVRCAAAQRRCLCDS
jgi:hypothetical protein